MFSLLPAARVGHFRPLGLPGQEVGFPQEGVILTLAWTLGGTRLSSVPRRNTLWESKKENLPTLKLFKGGV